MVNAPLSEDVAALRLTLYGRGIDGFVDNVAPATDARTPGYPGAVKEDVNDDDTWGGRVQLLIKPSEGTRILARVYHQDTETGGYPTTDTFDANQPIPGNNPADAMLGELQQSRTRDERSLDEFTLYNLEIGVEFGFADFTSVTSVLERDLRSNYESTDILAGLRQVYEFPDFVDIGLDFDFTHSLSAELNNITEGEDFIQEVRLTSNGDGSVNWIVGVFYSKQEKRFAQNSPTQNLDSVNAGFIPGFPMFGDNVFISEQNFKDDQFAVFADVNWSISEALNLIVGARWFDFEQTMVYDSIGGFFSAGVDDTFELSEDGVNPKFALEYRPGDNVLIYGQVAQGFRLGGANDPLPDGSNNSPDCELTSAVEPFESDSLWNYEAGVKATPNERVQINGAVYFIDWSDVPVADTRACGFARTLNASEVQSVGVEGDARLILATGLELSLNASYTDAKFTKAFTSSDGGFAVFDGTEAPLVPEWAFGVRALWRRPLDLFNSQGESFATFSYSYQGPRYNNANTNTRFKMDSYDLATLQIGYETETWRATLFAENLFDERAVILKDTIFLLHNRDTIVRPRTVGVSLALDF